MARDERRVTGEAVQAEVRADMDTWAARYPLFDPARFPALAVTTVAYLPTVRREDRALAALVSLWIIAFDALVDENGTDTAAVTTLATRYGALVDADHVERHVTPLRMGGATEQLAAALREIAALLTGYSAPSVLRVWWATSCRATIAAIVRQRELGRTEGPMPDYAAALPLLTDSIGVRPYLAIGAIVGREPGLAARLSATTALAGECALAIRLANDLRTWEKDELESGFNTLVALRAELAHTEPALSATVARERALAMLRARLAISRSRCHARFSMAAGAGATEAAMVRLMDVAVGIYTDRDYHTYRADGD